MKFCKPSPGKLRDVLGLICVHMGDEPLWEHADIVPCD